MNFLKYLKARFKHSLNFECIKEEKDHIVYQAQHLSSYTRVYETMPQLKKQLEEKMDTIWFVFKISEFQKDEIKRVREWIVLVHQKQESVYQTTIKTVENGKPENCWFVFRKTISGKKIESSVIEEKQYFLQKTSELPEYRLWILTGTVVLEEFHS